MSPKGTALVTTAGDITSAGLDDLDASFLADVPPIAIGILGFAVAKLFFAFGALNRPIILTLLSVFSAFLAVTFDLFRVFETNNDPSNETTRSLLVLREVFLAASVFIRYLFYLEYASRWPDSTTAVDNLTVRWWDWPILRLVTEAFLFLIAFVILVLQLVWRLADDDAVYTASAVFQLGWTTVIMLKMGYSIIVFPERTLRWKFARLVLPVMAALLLEWGVAVGNTVQHDFADSTAGRFLQAVEVYIIILTLMGISISRLVSQGPLTTLPSPAGEKRNRFAGITISKPILPQGLPRFNMRGAPRRAPRPPNDQPATQTVPDENRGPSIFRWFSSGSKPATDDRSRINLDQPTPIGTPEISQWRVQKRPSFDPDIASLRPPRVRSAVADVSRVSIKNLEMLDSGVELPSEQPPPRRSYLPPPTPPPLAPLPIPPPRAVLLRTPAGQASRPTSAHEPGSSVARMPSRYSGSRSSTFGHRTQPSNSSNGTGNEPSAIDPVLPRLPQDTRRVSFAELELDSSERRHERRSSAPLLSLTLPSPDRATKSMSNPGGGILTQSIQQLFDEQDELERAYTQSPDPRRSIVSSGEGPLSEEGMIPTGATEDAPSGLLSNSPDVGIAARNSSRSTFSLSRFPVPPFLARLSLTKTAPSAYLRQPASRFSLSTTSGVSDVPPRPPPKDRSSPPRALPQLTVDTANLRGSGVGLPANPRPPGRTGAWDVASFISGGPSTSQPSESSTVTTIRAPPPSAATPMPFSPSLNTGISRGAPARALSPVLPQGAATVRSGPIPRRNRNVPRVSLATLGAVSLDPRPKSTASVSDDEPALTRTASLARRVSRVRFVDTSGRLSIEGDADIDEEEMDDGPAEVRLAGRVVPPGVGTMSVARFRAAARTSLQTGPSGPARE